MYKNGIDIAIIDDGVNEDFYNIGSLKYNMEITPEIHVVNRKPYNKSLHSHATECAAIIRKYSPHACLSSIRILNEEKRALCAQLVRALEWCMEAGIGLINLSLGSIYHNDYAELRDIVNLAVKRNTVIVSACSNKQVITYPASFSNVIGVKCDHMGKLDEGQYIYNEYPNDGIDFTACSRHLLCSYDRHESYTQICNSYATPLITARAGIIIEKYPYISMEELKLMLAEGAINTNTGVHRTYLYKGIDWVEKAVVFSLNDKKDCFGNLKYSFRIADIRNLQCESLSDGMERIEQYLDSNCSILDEADTIVINVNKLTPEQMNCSSRQVLDRLEIKGKNIVYLDDNYKNNDLEFISSNHKLKVWHPSVYNYFDCHIKKEINVPIIAVYDFSGTNLIDFVCRLRECFENDGYNVVAAADTCVGIVCGLEYSPLLCKPIWQENNPRVLNVLYELFDPDILIYGINTYGKSVEYTNKIIGHYEIDINIIIANTYDKTIEKLVNSKKDSYMVLLTHTGNVPEYEQSKHNHTGLCLSSNNYIDDIYAHIISLYNNE